MEGKGMECLSAKTGDKFIKNRIICGGFVLVVI
jgi:hypothetical protein